VFSVVGGLFLRGEDAFLSQIRNLPVGELPLFIESPELLGAPLVEGGDLAHLLQNFAAVAVLETPGGIPLRTTTRL
jgi:hypothetical protein